jgi:hypothetical protein
VQWHAWNEECEVLPEHSCKRVSAASKPEGAARLSRAAVRESYRQGSLRQPLLDRRRRWARRTGAIRRNLRRLCLIVGEKVLADREQQARTLCAYLNSKGSVLSLALRVPTSPVNRVPRAVIRITIHFLLLDEFINFILYRRVRLRRFRTCGCSGWYTRTTQSGFVREDVITA